MDAFNRWRCGALAAALSLVTSVARAEMITPDSLPNPPSAVSATDGTAVYASNYVTTQYTGMGLSIGGAAITSVNGVAVWAPTGVGASLPGAPSRQSTTSGE
jgi:hypothetical protein